MSAFYLLALPESSGLMAGWHGAPARPVDTLKAAAGAVQLSLSLQSADSVDVTVTVTDGTSPVVATILAGQLYVHQTVAATWPAGASLTMTISAAGSTTGMGLSGNLWLEPAATGTLSPGLVTLAETKTRLGITGATAAQDVYLQAQIDSLSARIRDYCQHHITQRTYRDTWYKPTRAITSAPWLQSISSVDRDGTVLASSAYTFDARVGRIWSLESSVARDWHGTNVLVVEYVAGEADAPADVKEAIFTAIQKRWSAFSATGELPEERGSVRKQVFQDVGSIEYAAMGGMDLGGFDYLAGFPLAVLDAHRRMSMGYGEPSTAHIWEVLP